MQPMVEAHVGVPMAGAVLNTLNTRLDAEALGTAQRVAGLAPQAARLNKQMLRALKVPLALDGKAQAAIENIVNGASDPYAYADSAEHREGIHAFLAKRPPAF